MKNIIKTAWSCWNKTDRLVAIFSTIGIILLLCIFCTSCSAQTPSDIPDMEYNDASGEDFDYHGIPFYPDGIVDFIYCTQDNEFIIEYNDPDAFDMDNLPKTVNCVNGDSNYVSIYCSEEVFFECLEWYNSLSDKNNTFFISSNKFYIKEVTFEEDDYDGEDYRYYKLIKR